MKMIMAILRDEDSEIVSQALVSDGFRVTRIASTGGLLRRGITTMMVGLEDEKVEDALQLIRSRCPAAEVGQKRGTLFVLPVAHYEHL